MYMLMHGYAPDHGALINSMASELDKKPELRVFSSLTSQDYLLLNPGERGTIMFNDEMLNSHIPAKNIPEEFWPSLQTLRRTFSRSMEMGVRQIIGHFLAYAVDIARLLFDDARLVVNTEVDVPTVEVPEIGNIHGPLDYLTCR